MIGLTVDEDHERIDESPDLDPVTFDARRVRVTQPAVDAWGRHPKLLQARSDSRSHQAVTGGASQAAICSKSGVTRSSCQGTADTASPTRPCPAADATWLPSDRVS